MPHVRSWREDLEAEAFRDVGVKLRRVRGARPCRRRRVTSAGKYERVRSVMVVDVHLVRACEGEGADSEVIISSACCHAVTRCDYAACATSARRQRNAEEAICTHTHTHTLARSGDSAMRPMPRCACAVQVNAAAVVHAQRATLHWEPNALVFTPRTWTAPRLLVSHLLVGGAGVDGLGTVVVHLADQTTLQQLLDGSARQAAVDLQTLRQGGRGDELHLCAQTRARGVQQPASAHSCPGKNEHSTTRSHGAQPRHAPWAPRPAGAGTSCRQTAPGSPPSRAPSPLTTSAIPLKRRRQQRQRRTHEPCASVHMGTVTQNNRSTNGKRAATTWPPRTHVAAAAAASRRALHACTEAYLASGSLRGCAVSHNMTTTTVRRVHARSGPAGSAHHCV